MGAPIVAFRGVAKTYPGPPPVEAIRPSNIEIAVGMHVAVMGPSGSGKSTFLNIVGLLDRHTAGRYELDGVDTEELSERDRAVMRGRQIGFIFQSFHLLPYRTAEENVMLAQVYNGTPWRGRRAKARYALERIGLGHKLGALPTALSGGEQQRVAAARAIVNEPRLLLCDEPTGNLDSETAGALLDVVDGLHSGGLTVLVITHDPGVAARAERIVRTRDGVLAS